jgi:hypothetical protein
MGVGLGWERVLEKEAALPKGTQYKGRKRCIFSKFLSASKPSANRRAGAVDERKQRGAPNDHDSIDPDVVCSPRVQISS